MADNREIFEQVRAAVDIVDIVGECVALKRAGKEFKGLCPFHDDHKPSMAVVPQKQIFHCFVCGMGGDVFKFVKEYHKLTNGEALRMLAQRAGIVLPELKPSYGTGNQTGQSEGPSVREQIASTNEWACTFFQKTLQTPEGKAGLDYLLSRGLTNDTITKFRLGFAPESWTALTNAAMRLGTKMEVLDNAGLIKKRGDNSAYDVFRNRVIFPIIDATTNGGRVIAFGGRVLQEKRDEAGVVVEAKYLNTPETKLFNKSASVYGLNFARQQIVRTRTAVVVEGYMDVIACHQVGVTNVIATLGTALTPDHARILKNFAQTIVLIFDSDDAGRRAADRAMEVFVKTPLDIKIASVPDGKDPCDFCMKNGGEAFQQIVDSAVDALTFKWNTLRAQFQKSDSITARQDAITQFLQFTAASVEAKGGLDAIDPIRRGQLIIKLSTIVGLPIDEVTQMLFRFTKLKIANEQHARPINASQNDTHTGATGEASEQPRVIARVGKPAEAQRDAERWLVGFIIHRPELYGLVQQDISLDLFMHEKTKAELLLLYFENTSEEDRSSAAFCSFAEEQEAADPMIRAIIGWERMAARWEDLTEFSEAIAKLIVTCRNDQDHTPQRVILDCLQYMIDQGEARMRLFDANSLDGLTEEQHFRDIAAMVTRNQSNKNRSSIGYQGTAMQRSPTPDQSPFEETREALQRAAS